MYFHFLFVHLLFVCNKGTTASLKRSSSTNDQGNSMGNQGASASLYNFFAWTALSCSNHFIAYEESQNFSTFLGNEKNMEQPNNPTVLEICSERLPCDQSLNYTKSLITFYQTRLSPDACTLAIFFLIHEGKILNEALLSKSLEFMQSDAFLNENPKYVLLLLPATSQQEENSHSVINSMFLPSLQLIHTNTRYLIGDDEKNGDIKIICLHCQNMTEIPSNLLYNGGLEQVERLWMNLHKNLSGMSVIVKRTTLTNFECGGRINCDHLGIHFRGNYRICLVNFLSQYLNFKIVLDETQSDNVRTAAYHFRELLLLKDKTEGGPTSKSPFDIFNQIENFQVSTIYRQSETRHGERIEWIPHGWFTNPLQFILILNKASLSQSALYRPYDGLTWFLIMFSLLIVSLTLSCSLWTHLRFEKSYSIPYVPLVHPDIMKMFLMSIGSIIEQNPTDMTAKKNIDSFRIVFSAWLFVSIIISNAYTGVVISYLCSSVLPLNLPTSLQEVVRGPYPIITVDMIYIPLADSPGVHAHLTDALIQEYLYPFRNVIVSDLSDYRRYYMDVDSSTIYLTNITKEELILFYETETPIPKLLNSLKHPYKIPYDFVYVSTSTNVDRVLQLIKLNPNVVVWSPPSKERISVITAFTLFKNDFSVLFKRYSAFIIEAGFPEIWNKKAQKLHRKIDMRNYACLKKSSDRHTSNHSSIKEKDCKYSQNTQNESEPLPLEILLTPIYMFMFLTGAAVVTFLFEQFSRILKKKQLANTEILMNDLNTKDEVESKSVKSEDTSTNVDEKIVSHDKFFLLPGTVPTSSLTS